jgi:hypothetical protein
MTGVPNSVSPVDTMAAHFRKINQRLASLERASSSGGGGGTIDWTQGFSTYDPRYIEPAELAAQLGLYLPLTGGQLSGPLVIQPSPGVAEVLALKSPAATYAYAAFYQGTVRRGWVGAHPTVGDFYVAADTGKIILSAPNDEVYSSSRVQLDGVTQVNQPTDFWSLSSTTFFCGTLGAFCTNGSYRVGFYGNGWRSGTGWHDAASNGSHGSTAIELDPTGIIYLKAQPTAPTGSGGATIQVEIDGSAVQFHKTDGNVDSSGLMFDVNDRLWLTTPSGYNLLCVHIGAADANAQVFVDFRRPSNARIGSITQVSTTGVAFNTTSHGPFKGNVRDIDDDEAIDRVMRWRPVAFQWRTDDDGLSEDAEPSGDVHHGFIAQEMHEVNPDAVTPGYGTWAEHVEWRELARAYGAASQLHADWAAIDSDERGPEPFVPDDPGDDPFQGWQGDWSFNVPDLAAAVQALIRQNRALTARIAQLEGAH